MPLVKALEALRLNCIYQNDTLYISSKEKTFEIFIGEEKNKKQFCVSLDYVVTQYQKIIPLVLSKLSLNKTVFARNCTVQKIDKKTAEDFFNDYHFFGATNSAYNYGLFYKEEFIAAASFSKGRNMNRLPMGKQSFELIRFCSKSGITITGGLSKLMKHFFIEKNAGDIMTYVDKQFSNGDSFIKAGFKIHSETPPLFFLINKTTFERTASKQDESFDEKLFYKTQNAGNVKMIYIPKIK